ncbi:RNB domain-containing ribonuclease [Exilibacterium tricleocarpae]|uniref:RNB domain-containing ribonuclease n=1 Tax=Exilibacterium tricleocarpae TaxID=2591008 RepID=A0A545U3D7_9GAMM|nr:RNB domain-containing ribonuclease [Exilibacterium tricleocarpae]TQV83992.1 RNB domain-containing ribonuclease [Exilibacterium tricleocarpae]
MLKDDALQQLTQLKASIRAQKDLAQGVVRGTQGRFGFVMLDDGREAFLNPDTMQRVFPGDRVEVNVITNAKGKPEAELEKLISSDFKAFTGRYLVRGKGHFVATDYPLLNRWIFLPPKSRSNAKDGDFVAARVTRHPFHNDGKGQAKIEAVIGAETDVGIERRYIIAKHKLPEHWSKAAEQQLQAQQAVEGTQQDPGARQDTTAAQQETAGTRQETEATPQAPADTRQQLAAPLAPTQGDNRREDFSHLPFFTIDAETTRDMDDALFIEAAEDGWQLYVAIADPTGLIAVDSPIDRIARRRANTVYLTGGALTMLPETLSHQTVSLVAQAPRPALVCKLTLAASGAVSGFEFAQGIIRSRQKLSYHKVADYLEQVDGTGIDAEIGAVLALLAQCSNARYQYRAEHALIMDERPDYELVLNAQQKIERIEKQRRTVAHRIVEEAMLATNCCAGELLAEHRLGLFSCHAGFREERLADVQLLLEENGHGSLAPDVGSLDGYRAVILALQREGEARASILSTLKRMLQPSRLSLDAEPHFGLGFTRYATVTSPIRRYQDYFNHLAIKQIIADHKAPSLSGDDLEAIRQQLAVGRLACKQLDQWLLCQYIQRHWQAQKDAAYAGKIVLLNSQGLGIRLDDTGIEGFVSFNHKKDNTKKNSKKKDADKLKLSFDQHRLLLKVDDTVYRLDEPVQVKVVAVDMDKRQISFALVA